MPKDTRPRNASTQRVVTLALDVLDDAAYRSSTHKVDALEVRLALASLWVILKDRKYLRTYWDMACSASPHPWESCRESYYGIAMSLRNEGWNARAGRPPPS